MPINIPGDLPARNVLEREHIFVMTKDRAERQDIRPLQIAIVNLMPTKIATEIQLLRLLGNSPVQVDITLLKAENHISKNTAPEHLERFYTTFSQVRHKKFDGMIITGAPVEQLPFAEVDYWDELKTIMDYSRDHVFSTLHICWGAQAGLFHHYGIDKCTLPGKMFGVFSHAITDAKLPIFRGFDDVFHAPHSRHTGLRREDIQAEPELEILAESPEAQDFDRIRQLFDDLERARDIAEFLDLTEEGAGVRIFIGSENKLFSLSGSSLVVSPYMNADRKIIGAVGVIGPTRLNYGRIVPIVDYTAQLVGRLVGDRS